MYYDPNIQQNEWLVETCQMCGSTNHIFVDNSEAHAWECWCCGFRFWLDELGRDAYLIDQDIDDIEAEERLDNADLSIYFLNGQCER